MRGVGGLLAVPSSLSSCLPVARHLDPPIFSVGIGGGVVCGWGLGGGTCLFLPIEKVTQVHTSWAAVGERGG
jgi:hypothetical protein